MLPAGELRQQELASARSSAVMLVAGAFDPSSRSGCSITNGMRSAPCQKSTAFSVVDPTIVMLDPTIIPTLRLIRSDGACSAKERR